MDTHRIRTRPPTGERREPRIECETDLVARFLEDAAHYPGGEAAGVAFPTTEAEVAALLTLNVPVLAVGAQSSLTGGATPAGELVVSTAKLTDVSVQRGTVRAGAGVVLDTLQQTLSADGAWYPPVPTWTGATCGGVVSTNAAGPATFKYGSTRPWVQALTVVLADGGVLDIERGRVRAHPDGFFEIAGESHVVRVPVPRVRTPDVPKQSAGYHGGEQMDLIDLFIGSEGTLGIIVGVTFRTLPRPGSVCHVLVPVPSESAALGLVADLRRASLQARASKQGAALDVTAVEHIDRRSLAIVREDGVLAREAITLPADSAMLLLVELELDDSVTAEDGWAQIGSSLEPDAPRTPLVQFCRLLATYGLLDRTEIALPGQRARAARFAAIREAVPTAVNARVARAKATVDGRISKTAADVIVPFERLGDLLDACHAIFERAEVDAAIWGHFSDGNLHPNVIPRTWDEVERGRDAILEIGRTSIDLGGCPLAEHGVGRNPLKKQLLRALHGEAGISSMIAVKRALDPRGLLAPGVLF